MTDSTIKTKSILTCPYCANTSEEDMALNSCQYFFECPNCKIILKAKEGDCCVFCSYGSVKCPPIQKNENCC